MNILSKFVLCSCLIFSFSLHAKVSCEESKVKVKKNTIKDSVCNENVGRFDLHYSAKHRKIWIENKKSRLKIQLDFFEKNQNPELVGMDDSIRFVDRQLVEIDGRYFLPVIFSHRSRSNDGKGYCGSGAEVYFSAIEILKNKVMQRNKILIESCLEPYMLDGHDGTVSNPYGKLENKQVVFDWLIFADKDFVTGRFDFIKNEIFFEPKKR
jgi:hypothetical protein